MFFFPLILSPQLVRDNPGPFPVRCGSSDSSHGRTEVEEKHAASALGLVIVQTVLT
jgi:hypothetical protein